MISSTIQKVRENRFLFILLSAFLIITACEGPAGPQGDQGPAGQDGADGLDGEDGNANVTVYIFDGIDFTATTGTARSISGLTETEMQESAWDVYIIKNGFYYHMPGYGFQDASFYETYHSYSTSSSMVAFRLERKEGTGELYDEVRIVRTAANNVTDNTTTKVSGDAPNPRVDFSNYGEVVEYYNIDSDNIVDMRSD